MHVETKLVPDWRVYIPFDPQPEWCEFVSEEHARQLYNDYKRNDSWGSQL